MSAFTIPKDVRDLLHQKVFYFHPHRGWEAGSVHSMTTQENRAGTMQVILTMRSSEDEQLHDVVYKASLVRVCSGGIEQSAPDNLLTLTELHHGVLVQCLRIRHKRDVMYTNMGELVVALNPFKYSIPWYQDDQMANYLQHLDREDLPPEIKPHCWSVAHRAYVLMRKFQSNHSIIISGESGSGKTESCKMMLKYLCHASERSTHHAEALTRQLKVLSDRVQLSNVLLEAFGNAKTLRNDNSSRFGKFTEVQFHASGALVGMRTTPFLLERSRIIHCGQDERVFHCFYQLLAGASKEQQTEMQLRNVRDFSLLTQGKCTSLKSSGVDDAAEFRKVNHALTELGFRPEEQRTIWRVVAAVAHLQNVRFVDPTATQFGKRIAADDHAQFDPASGSEELVTFIASKLLMLPDSQALHQALLTSVTTVKGETVVRKLSVQKASDQRDSISKLLYSKLFLWLVHRINDSTAHSAFADGTSLGDAESSDATNILSAEPSSWIALLDIFGFEDFPTNSFEQFCINLANEALQRHYVKHNFIRDLEEMNNEGISTHQVKFQDNLPCVELLQGAKNSVVAVLDDCSTLDLERASTNPDLTFLSKLTAIHRPEYQTSGSKGGKSVLDRAGGPTASETVALDKPSDFFYRGRLDDDSFTVRHYAADVKYQVAGFIEKNMDHARDSSRLSLLSTTDAVLCDILEMDENVGLLADLALSSPRGSTRGGVTSPGSPRGGAVGPLGGKGGARKSVASQFRSSLQLLMDALEQSHPHWVRCIRPHPRKAPNLFDGKLVLEQLVATGVLSTIEQRQRNFPFRMMHQDFIRRFGVIAFSSLRRLGSRTTWAEKSSVVLSALRQRLASGATTTPATNGTPPPQPAPRDDEGQIGKGKVFLSKQLMQLLEEHRVSLLNDHVRTVCVFAAMFQARKVVCRVLWTKCAIACQRGARRVLRMRRAVREYYAELRRRIVERHLQEQRDLASAESRARPRWTVEANQAFQALMQAFRLHLGPMIATVLHNIRSVEATKRDSIHAELQMAYWELEATFAAGVADAHERRNRRLESEHAARVEARRALWELALAERMNLVRTEQNERHALQEVTLRPKVSEILRRSQIIREQQLERNKQVALLRSQRDAEVRRLQLAEERRIERELQLWRSVIGEEAYLTELVRWRRAPPEVFHAFLREFCVARLPSSLLKPGHLSSPSADAAVSGSQAGPPCGTPFDAARVLLCEWYEKDRDARREVMAESLSVDVSNISLADLALADADTKRAAQALSPRTAVAPARAACREVAGTSAIREDDALRRRTVPSSDRHCRTSTTSLSTAARHKGRLPLINASSSDEEGDVLRQLDREKAQWKLAQGVSSDAASSHEFLRERITSSSSSDVSDGEGVGKRFRPTLRAYADASVAERSRRMRPAAYATVAPRHSHISSPPGSPFAVRERLGDRRQSGWGHEGDHAAADTSGPPSVQCGPLTAAAIAKRLVAASPAVSRVTRMPSGLRQ